MSADKNSVVTPYQFEQLTDSEGSDAEDGSSGWDTVEECSDAEQEFLERNQKEASHWCLCGSCQKMPTSIECLCCKEREATKEMVEQLEIDM